MTSKINYIRKNRLQCICVIVIYWIVLIFNNKKNKYEKKYYKDFIVLNVILRVQVTNIWHII